MLERAFPDKYRGKVEYQPVSSDPKSSPHRPGCVTAYAIFIVAIHALVLGFRILASLLENIDYIGPGLGLPEIVAGPWYAGIFMVILDVASAVGIWRMRKWGWRLVMLSFALGVYNGIQDLIISWRDGTTGDIVCDAIWLPLLGIPIYWFLKNRNLFNGEKNITIL
jgi:hypothetical protein